MQGTSFVCVSVVTKIYQVQRRKFVCTQLQYRIHLTYSVSNNSCRYAKVVSNRLCKANSVLFWCIRIHFSVNDMVNFCYHAHTCTMHALHYLKGSFDRRLVACDREWTNIAINAISPFLHCFFFFFFFFFLIVHSLAWLLLYPVWNTFFRFSS